MHPALLRVLGCALSKIARNLLIHLHLQIDGFFRQAPEPAAIETLAALAVRACSALAQLLGILRLKIPGGGAPVDRLGYGARGSPGGKAGLGSTVLSMHVPGTTEDRR